MSNFLDMACPACGCEDQIDILAAIWVRVTDDGTDPDLTGDRSHSYEPESTANCVACNHWGTVAEFTPTDPPG